MELMDVFRIFRFRQPLVTRMPSEISSISEITENDDTEMIRDTVNSLNEPTISTPLTGAEAIRLFNSIHAQHSQNRTNFVLNDLHETNSKPICRICRCDSTNLLIECPCRCKGSVGFVHETCLKKWKNYKRDNFCEICKFEYNRPLHRGSFLQILKSFFQVKYFGKILKYFINVLALTPIAYFNITQLVEVLETFNEDDLKHIIAIPTFLILTGIFICFYFEWLLNTMIKIQQIFNHWWNIGSYLQTTEIPPSIRAAANNLQSRGDLLDTEAITGHNLVIELDDDDDDFFASLNDDFFGF